MLSYRLYKAIKRLKLIKMKFFHLCVSQLMLCYDSSDDIQYVNVKTT